MKLKENNDKISLKILPVIFALSFVAATIVRAVQYFGFIDHVTGFSTGSALIPTVFYIIIAVAFLCFIVISYLSKESSVIEIADKKNNLAAVGSAFFAITLLYDFFASFVNGVESFNAYSSEFKEMMVSGSLPSLLQSLFALLSAVFVLILAIDFGKGTSKASKRKILCLAPLGWVSFRLIHGFIRQISFIKVTDLFMELIMLSVMILFFLAFAQVNSSVYSDGFRWRIPAFGFCTALVSGSLSTARLIYAVANGAGSLNAEHPFNICDFAFAFFAISVIFAVTDCKNKKAADNV